MSRESLIDKPIKEILRSDDIVEVYRIIGQPNNGKDYPLSKGLCKSNNGGYLQCDITVLRTGADRNSDRVSIPWIPALTKSIWS